MADRTNTTAAARPRRADAERSIARILDAAVDSLSRDPDASMAEIARQAGVVRATIYVHFPTRETLIAAVTDRAIEEVTRIITETQPRDGEPIEALERVVRAAWKTLGRYHALVAVNSRLPHAELHDRHAPVIAALLPLIERGQNARAFRPDVPAAWHLATLLALIHSASAELAAGRVADDLAETALVASVVGALTGGTAR